MKKLTTLLILILSFTAIAQGPPPEPIRISVSDRQKIEDFRIRNDSLILSLQNAGTNKVDLSGIIPDISGKANTNSPTFTGSVKVPTATLSNEAVNKSQLDAAIAGVETGGGAGLVQENASTRALTKEDAWKVFRNRGTTDFTYTIPSQANGAFTEDIGYTFWTGSTGRIFVKGQTGAGVSPREISDAERYVTLTRMGPDLWDWSQGTLPWQSNLYTLLNSANPDNEVNAITGITGVTNWMPVSVSSNPAPHTGGYSIKLTHGEGVSAQKTSPVTLTGLTIGNTYKVGVWIIKLSDSSLGGMSVELSNGSGGWTISQTLASIATAVPKDVWLYYEVTGEVTSTTPLIRFRTSPTTTDLGASFAYDSITVEEVTP